MSNYEEYKDLLSKSYDEAVEFLLQKYGPAQDDYFREKSYKRFMNKEIKSIAKGNISRTSEGLYCHHIDEKIMLKMADFSFIKIDKIPFDYQKKERLVYCDLIEHNILHVLIAKETSLEFGYPGFIAFLVPDIEIWYLNQITPVREWEKNCYKKSFLDPQEAFNILNKMHKMLDESYYNSLSEYYEEKMRQEKERNNWIKEREQRLKDERIELISNAKLLHDKSPRQTIVGMAYNLKCSDPMSSFNSIRTKPSYKEFDSKMKIYPKEKILEELKIYLENLVESNNDSISE